MLALLQLKKTRKKYSAVAVVRDVSLSIIALSQEAKQILAFIFCFKIFFANFLRIFRTLILC